MKHSVARMLGGVGALVSVTACGLQQPVELEVGQAYCLAAGADPNNPVDDECDSVHTIMIARDSTTLERLMVSDQDFTFQQRYQILGREIDLGNNYDELVPIKMVDDHIMIGEPEDEEQDYRLWLVPGQTAKARRLKELHQRSNDLDATQALPDDQPAYVDVPLCYQETQLTDNEITRQSPLCGYDITFFASNGFVVEI